MQLKQSGPPGSDAWKPASAPTGWSSQRTREIRMTPQEAEDSLEATKPLLRYLADRFCH